MSDNFILGFSLFGLFFSIAALAFALAAGRR